MMDKEIDAIAEGGVGLCSEETFAQLVADLREARREKQVLIAAKTVFVDPGPLGLDSIEPALRENLQRQQCDIAWYQLALNEAKRRSAELDTDVDEGRRALQEMIKVLRRAHKQMDRYRSCLARIFTQAQGIGDARSIAQYGFDDDDTDTDISAIDMSHEACMAEDPGLRAAIDAIIARVEGG